MSVSLLPWTEPLVVISAPVHSSILGFIQSYVMAGVLVAGVLGNVLSFVVFVRSRKRADACVQYLSCLALSDTAVIISRGATEWVNSGLRYLTDGRISYNLFQYSTASCKLVSYFQQVSQCISGWMIVSYSVERAYVVLFPLKRQSISPTGRRILIYSLCVAMVFLAVHRLILEDIMGEDPILCFYVMDPTIGTIIYQLDVMLYNYLPCTLIFVSNVLILSVVFRSKKTDLQRTTPKTSNEGRLLLSLMLVSSLYVLFLMPHASLASYNYNNRDTLPKEKAVMLYNAMMFLMQIQILNYCLNFVIYGCTLPFYREEVVRIFRCETRRVDK